MFNELLKSKSNWLHTQLEDHLLIAEPTSGCIGLLNPLAAWVLEAKSADLSDEEITASLARQFDMDFRSVREGVNLAITMQKGLVDQAQNPQPRESKPAPSNTTPISSRAFHTLQLNIGLQTVCLEVQSTNLYTQLGPIIEHLKTGDTLADNRLQLLGSNDYWQVALNNEVLVDGSGPDAAVCHTICELVELGCQPDDGQLVVHGAGVCSGHHGALLIGVGGSGKTTLAAALNQSGFGLINDDVIAVSGNGHLTSACMSLCLKHGSWPVLSSRLPAINKLPTFTRYGEPVKYLPPRHPLPVLPVNTSVFIFPCFHKAARSTVEKLESWQILQGVVEAESFIPDLDQQRLEFLADWVGSAPGYRIQYPDIESGVKLASQLIRKVVEQ